jgi:sulfur carrier protein
MNVVVNGESRELPAGATVATVVELFSGRVGTDLRGVAVALRGAVVRRAEWPATLVTEGDRLEVLSAIGGG